MRVLQEVQIAFDDLINELRDVTVRMAEIEAKLDFPEPEEMAPADDGMAGDAAPGLTTPKYVGVQVGGGILPPLLLMTCRYYFISLAIRFRKYDSMEGLPLEKHHK